MMEWMKSANGAEELKTRLEVFSDQDPKKVAQKFLEDQGIAFKNVDLDKLLATVSK